MILANLDKYEPLVHRHNENEGLAGCDYDPDDSDICTSSYREENRGKQKALGIGHHDAVPLTGLRRWTLRGEAGRDLDAEPKRQTGNGDPYISNLGRFVTDGVVQRWRHRVNFDWSRGAWSVNLANSFSSGYDDQNSAIDTNTGLIVGKNKVKAYPLWDLSGGWDATSALTSAPA